MAAVQDDEEKPLDPAVERVRRRLVRFIVINLGILFVALMAVAIALVYRIGDDGPSGGDRVAVAPPSDGGPVEARIPAPDGSRMVSQSVSDTRIAVAFELADGSRQIIVHDLASGALVARFAVGAP